MVGVACRLPRAPDLKAFWRLLAAGQHAIGETPAERLSAAGQRPGEALPAGEPGVRFGAFLDRVDRFDPAFFGISPREAAAMDPQQRLVLELAWEALEDARIVPERIRGEGAGVFLGSIANDYSILTHRSGPDAIGRHTVTGLHRSIIANRVSYTLGLTGPSLTVDAAQSSSLVAVHLACEALHRGEATLALAGGVHLNLDPRVALGASRFGGLSPDGRCFVFDSRANGYVRGEGGGVVALKLLASAEADGDRIYGVIRGSAVNNDGPSEGLTVPSRAAQESVIRSAYERAGLERSEVQYVELHGTGTAVGDPIEAAALGGALGEARPDGDPLPVGSAKTNVGHLEGAAGIVGLLKALLAIEHRQIPASLNFRQPNSEIPLEALGVRVQDSHGAWPHEDRPLIAGVSSFGMGGTNCHLVLEQAPAAEPAAADPPTEPLPGPIPLALSAKAEPALAEAAERLATHLQADPDLDPTDIAYSLVTTRSAFEHRAVVLGKDREGLLASLTALAEGTPSADVLSGRAKDGKLAYLFTGQGSQRLGMGKELHETDEVFAKAFDAVCEQLDPHLETPLKELIFAKGKKAAAKLEDTTYAQPALFAIEVALHEALAERGLKPDLLAGHSIGELAAAHVAGVFDLADAAKLVAARGRLMGALPAGGAMAAIEASEEEVSESIAGKEAELSIAAINGPRSTVISGAEEAVEAIRSYWKEQGRKTKRLAVSHAFHSPLIEPMLEEFAEVAESLAYSEPQTPIVSDVTGEVLGQEQATDPAYWVSHVREPVRFADAIATLQAQGTSAYLELGPDPVLCAMARECLGE
ncbi:MAG TPA: type I polyketide synthase, partial [Solirubrobacterales bacterium]